MEGKVFTTEEAARILGCDRRTVQRLLAQGWLWGPTEWKANDRQARVCEKSLFQLMFDDQLSHFPARTLKVFKKHGKISGRFSRQIATASCLSSNVGEGQSAVEPSKPHEQARRCRYHDFAEQRQFSFGWMARQLAPGDPSLQDDLVQEMSLAVLEYEGDASPDYLFELAVNHAKNYLKYESVRGMLPLSEVQNMTDPSAAKITSLNNFIDGLLESGVPAEWIEEVLGRKLDVA